jgi:type II secretory pathway pseudopilin PulG
MTTSFEEVQDMGQRESFITFAELLRELASQCRAAGSFLGSSDRRQLDHTEQLAEWVARRQLRLAEGLERCASQGPQDLVGRELQFKSSYRAWHQPATIDQGLRQTIELNKAIARVLSEESEKAAPVDVSDQILELSQLVETVNRKLSLARVMEQDL